MTTVGWIVGQWRRWRARHDLYDDQPARHPALAQIQQHELIPFKGTWWQVQEIREQPVPCIILVPVSTIGAHRRKGPYV